MEFLSFAMTVPLTPALEPEARSRLRRLIASQPGVPVGVARRSLAVGWGTFYHHLAILRARGDVEVRAIGRRVLLFEKGGAAQLDAQASAALTSETARRIARHIILTGGCDVKDIIAATGDSPRVVYYHVRRLVDARLVRSRARTRLFDLTAEPVLIALLAAP